MAAKNWTLKEAVGVIVDGIDTEAMQELGKRFPLTSLAIARMGSNVGANTLFGAMPDHMTMLKMERSLKEGIEESDEDQDDEAEGVDAEEAGEEDLASMSTKELMKLCDKRGIKVPHYGKNKQFYLDALAGGAVESDDEDEDAADDVEEKEDPSYEEMTAMELYKLCKKRKIKTEPKQKAAVYIKLLKAADAAEDEASGDTDEDWGDEEEKPAPKKAEKPAKGSAKGKGTSKPAAKKEAEDEEEDWDI